MNNPVKASKIILITIDTLRWDRLGCYGYRRDTTPNLDVLAGESVLFKNAFTPCSYTVPTHAAILTGRYPSNLSTFFSQVEGELNVDQSIMLQEMFVEKGFETAAFISSQVLGRRWGLGAGFGLYDDETTASESNRPEALYRRGEDTNARLFAWLEDNRDKDFFLWVHYFDVHGPYSPPGPGASAFNPKDYGSGPELLDMVPDGAAGGIPEYQLLGVKRDLTGAIVEYERDARVYLARYDAGVRYEDRVVGELVERLKGLGIYDDTAVILTSDHGETLGEGGVFFFHGLTVTPEQVRVPLLVKLPGGRRGGESIDAPVSTIDIMPTVLDIAGIDRTRVELDGMSLIGQGDALDRFIMSENEWQRAVIHKDYCLVMEKAVIRDGFSYYFDSKELCKGVRLYDCRTGRELGWPGGADTEKLNFVSEIMYRFVDPKEVTIRIKDNSLRAFKEMEREIQGLKEQVDGIHKMIAEKDEYIEGLAGELEVREEYVKGLKDAVEEKDRYIESLKPALEEKDRYIESLRPALDEKDRYIESLKPALEEKDRYIESLKPALDEKDRYIESLKPALEEKDRYIESLKPALEKKDEYIADLVMELEKRAESIRSMEIHIAEKDKCVADLNMCIVRHEKCTKDLEARSKEIEAALRSTRGSLSWRMTKPLRWVRERAKGILRRGTKETR